MVKLFANDESGDWMSKEVQAPITVLPECVYAAFRAAFLFMGDASYIEPHIEFAAQAISVTATQELLDGRGVFEGSAGTFLQEMERSLLLVSEGNPDLAQEEDLDHEAFADLTAHLTYVYIQKWESRNQKLNYGG